MYANQALFFPLGKKESKRRRDRKGNNQDREKLTWERQEICESDG